MDQNHPVELVVPPALASEIVAAAEAQHRPPLEVLGDAVKQYLAERRYTKSQRSPAEAAARIVERRKGVALGGLTIKDLISEGRP